MMPDRLSQFRKLLDEGSNESPGDYPKGAANVSGGDLGRGGGNFGGGGFGGGSGMDPWQASVEKRLDSLDRRLTSIETDAGTIKVDLATVKTKVEHLPSKGFIVTTTLLALTALSLIVGAVANLDKLLPKSGSNASLALPQASAAQKP